MPHHCILQTVGCDGKAAAFRLGWYVVHRNHAYVCKRSLSRILQCLGMIMPAYGLRAGQGTEAAAC